MHILQFCTFAVCPMNQNSISSILKFIRTSNKFTNFRILWTYLDHNDLKNISYRIFIHWTHCTNLIACIKVACIHCINFIHCIKHTNKQTFNKTNVLISPCQLLSNCIHTKLGRLSRHSLVRPDSPDCILCKNKKFHY